MATDYLLQENGDKILLEDGTGALLLESSDGGGGPVGPPLYLIEYRDLRRR